MSTVQQDAQIKETSVSRRDFLRAGSLSVVGLSVAEKAARARLQQTADGRSCIFILMTGGPSQFETFDPKPEAPMEIRGPLKAISTAVAGVSFNESLPLLAERAGKLAVIRSLYHDAAPIHETGLQLLQTGRLSSGAVKYPSFGSVIARALGPRNGVAPYVVLPRPVGDTGVKVFQGQTGGFLGHAFDPLATDPEQTADASAAADVAEPPAGVPLFRETVSVRRTYGENHFGRLCLQARQLVECGVRSVTVNLFDSLSNQVTWDCHARSPWSPGTLYDYRDTLCPQFDRALAALIDDLQQRGRLDDTLVVAVGEMGRTPYLNEFGGRDHWPGVWSAVLAGGGVEGGRVIGASDRTGSAPADRPIHPGELTATIYDRLGLDLDMPLRIDDETETTLVDHQPIAELFS